MKIKKGDNVIVMKGKDKGSKGTVEKVFPSTNKVLISGVNMKKKHEKSRSRGKSGQIVEMAMPISASNVMVADPKGGKPTRVGYKVDGDTKTRVATKSGSKL